MKLLIIGMGEIGTPLFDLLSHDNEVIGLDMDKSRNRGQLSKKVDILNICFGYSIGFADAVLGYAATFKPKMIVIHSTVKPYTTKEIQEKVSMPVIYSPMRGVHATMQADMMSYTKFYASYKEDAELFKEAFGIFTLQRASSPHLLEYSKILVDTSYYGWLIAYAQYTNEICMKEKMDYDELWKFAEEIHAKRKDRPKMRPGFIGGHCVIPNAKILNDETMKILIDQNDRYGRLLG